MSGHKFIQIAAGTSERNYTHLFLDHDVMLIGPGNPGPFDKDKMKDYKLPQSGDYSQLNSFVNYTAPGHIVLLRNVHRIVAVGVVAEADYKWSETFDDVYGWDLQHVRRVIWQDQLTQELDALQDKEGDLYSHMKQIPTISAVNSEKVLDPIKPLLSNLQERELRELPPAPPAPLELDDVGHELFSRGLPNDSVDRLIQSIQRQRRMLKWYGSEVGKQSGRPTEHEVVAHMILPFMLALGWSEQLLAVEWKRIDLAAFWGTPTTEDKCELVCEAKGLGHGLQNVYEQAKRYTERYNLSPCTKTLLTDGARLYLYEKANGQWNEKPSGYINIMKIRTNHVAPENTSAINTIMALTPSGIGREVNG
jgi:hypothetical protein